MPFVDLATARSHTGPVLLVATVLPSPWSEAAKGIFHAKELEVAVVRYRSNDTELIAWSGAENVPLLLCQGEPRRTGWAEILMFAERSGGRISLLPDEASDRVRLFGLGHEIAGEGGLGWSSRLLMIHGAFATNGVEGLPLVAAKTLAPKYGYAEDRIAGAKQRIADVLGVLDRMLEKSRSEGRAYLLGNRLTALDIYLATFLTPLVGVTEEECPRMLPLIRPAFSYLKSEAGASVTPALTAYRATILQRHLAWPIAL
jgi:glutathione S-transferase